MTTGPMPPSSDRTPPAGNATHPEPRPPAAPRPPRTTRLSAAWVAVGVALVLLVLLIIFMLQNSTKVEVQFLGTEGKIPLGLAMLIAAVGGGAMVAVVGIGRIAQLRLRLRRSRRDKVDRD